MVDGDVECLDKENKNRQHPTWAVSIDVSEKSKNN